MISGHLPMIDGSMTRINAEIPQQNFELLGEQIGLILFSELRNQEWYTINFKDPEVFVERMVPVDKSEVPIINISLSRGDYGNKDYEAVDGLYIYNIDCYAAAMDSLEGRGDNAASKKLLRVMGLVRAILENPVYRTLDYCPPSISSVRISNFVVSEPSRNPKDATNQKMARIEFEVRVTEGVQLKCARELKGSDTGIKLGLTDEGYKYQLL